MSDAPQPSEGTTPPPGKQRYVLQLFITGATVRSRRAVANIRLICEDHLGDNYDLEIIDIYQHPERTREQQIVAAPTLVKVLPLPLRRIVGDLSDGRRVLSGLALEERAP